MFLSAGEGAAGDRVRYKERKKSSEEGKKGDNQSPGQHDTVILLF
jgi:hypothetical protein